MHPGQRTPGTVRRGEAEREEDPDAQDPDMENETSLPSDVAALLILDAK